MDLAADVLVMLRDVPGAVAVSSGAMSGFGVFDRSANELSDGINLVERINTVLVAYSAFTTLARGATITVDGTSFTVRDIVREVDGATLRVVLA